jgi:hypothetical protein
MRRLQLVQAFPMSLATWLQGQERLLHIHQESTTPAIFEIINRLPSSEF